MRLLLEERPGSAKLNRKIIIVIILLTGSLPLTSYRDLARVACRRAWHGIVQVCQLSGVDCRASCLTRTRAVGLEPVAGVLHQ